MGKRSRLRTQDAGRRRLAVLLLVLCLVLAVYGWYEKEATINLWDRASRLVRSGTVQFTPDREIPRGTIYDRNYRELAITYERVSVYANIREIEDVNQVLAPLAKILETSENDLYDRVGEGRLRVWLARDITQDQEEAIRALDLPGIYLHKEYVRFYPQRESAAHLIGFVERGTGLAGMEQYFNKLEARHRLGRDDPDELRAIGATRPGIDGRHLVLTLDFKIQQVLEQYLDDLAPATPWERFGVLVMEAGSGALVGYAQRPSYDPNAYHGYPEAVFTDLFGTEIPVPEPFRLLLREVALLESQNDPAAGVPWSVAAERRKLGVQLQLWNRLGADGLEQIDFIGTPAAAPDRTPFSATGDQPRDFGTVPELLTPLQLLTAFTRTVNGGLGVTPHGGDRFVLRQAQQEFLLEDLSPEAEPGVVTPAVSAEARRLLQRFGRPGPLESTVVAGRSRSKGAGAGLQAHLLGLITVPAEAPELVFLVAATGPGYQAGRQPGATLMTAAEDLIGPVVARQRVMKNLADMMRPTLQEDVNFPAEAGSRPAAGTAPAGLDLQTEMVPLIGMSLRKSLRILQATGVELQIRGSGRVVDQEPAPGTLIGPGTTVTLILEPDPVEPVYRPLERIEPE